MALCFFAFSDADSFLGVYISDFCCPGVRVVSKAVLDTYSESKAAFFAISGGNFDSLAADFTS